jgi:hypothetical protein
MNNIVLGKSLVSNGTRTLFGNGAGQGIYWELPI